MRKWIGASAVCINDQGQLLMVLQGKPDEEKNWSVPSGGVERNESFEECCKREVDEETGYKVKVVEKILVKKRIYEEWQVEAEVHYFFVRLVGGERKIQDPDKLIYDVAWKSIDEIKTLPLTYPEDRAFLIEYVKSKVPQL